MEDSDRSTDSSEDTTWETNPLPLMVKHPPRVTASNTKIQLDQEGILSQACPKGENDLGWVQLQQKSLLWQEKIEGSLVVTHEGLTTMAQSSRTGWTIMSGTWNHLRKVWGPTPDTLAKIQASCKLKKVWKKQTFSHPRDTSFWSSNDYGKSIGCMTYQRWRRQPSFPQSLKEMNAGGEHKI